MYLVDWLEKCSFRFGTPVHSTSSINSIVPRPVRPSDCDLDPSGREQGYEPTGSGLSNIRSTDGVRGGARGMEVGPGCLWGGCNDSTDLVSVRFESVFGCVVFSAGRWKRGSSTAKGCSE